MRRRPDPESWYRMALLAYPKAFRRQYADELLDVFRARYAATRSLGRGARWSCLVDAMRSAAWHGSALRLESGSPLTSAAMDIRDAARGLRRAPGFALLVVAVLAVAVGASTAIFSIVHGTLLQTPAGQEDVVLVWGSNPRNGQLRDVVAGSNFVDFERSATAFSSMAAFVVDEITMLEAERPEVIAGISATTGFFETLGAEAAHGRLFDAREGASGGEPIVVLAHELWSRRFGADPAVIGRQLRINGTSATVIGVLPEEFRFVFPADAYVPLYRDVIGQDSRTHYHYWVLGRLRAAASIAMATEELDAVLRRVAEEEDPRMGPWTVLVEPLGASTTAAVRPVLAALGVSVGLVLVIAVANLANLLAIRGTRRAPEMALRVALGARRSRVVRQLLVEGVVLASAGAVTGLVVAGGILRLLPRIAPATVAIPGSAARVASFHAQLDPTMAAFCVAISLTSGLLFSLPAAVRATRAGDPASLGQGDRSRTASQAAARAFDALVVAEIAMATLLVISAFGAVSDLTTLATVDPGLDPRGVVTMFVGDLGDRDAAARASYYRQVVGAVRRVPGVVAVGLNDYVPFLNEDDFEGVVFPDRPPPRPGEGIREEWRRVSPDYFETAGVRLLDGRGFDTPDFAPAARSVAIVNEAFARKHFPRGVAVGALMVVTDEGYGDTEIVGVVADVRRRGLAEPAPPVVYVPYPPAPRTLMALFVRTAGAAAPPVEAIQEAVWSVDSSQPIQGVRPLEDIVRASIGVPRLTMAVLLALAATAVVLAVLGVAGVVGYRVRARRRELGIRLALGATGATLQRQLVGWAIRVGAPAILLGLLGLFIVETLLGNVPGAATSGHSRPLAAAFVALSMLALTVVATSVPARRIVAIDPTESLRDD